MINITGRKYTNKCIKCDGKLWVGFKFPTCQKCRGKKDYKEWYRNLKGRLVI